MVTARPSPSIHLRLLLASVLILPLFLGVTAWVLDRAFANYQMETQQESMRLQQLLLAKAADFDGDQWRFDDLDELRFNLLRSGLYAFVLADEGRVVWQSPLRRVTGWRCRKWCGRTSRRGACPNYHKHGNAVGS